MTDACRASRVALLEGDAPHAAHVAQCPECQRLAQAIADVDAERIEALDAYVARPLSPPRPANWRVPMAIVLVLAAVALASPLLPSSAPPAPTVEATSEGAAAVVALVESTALLRWNALTDLEWDRRAQAIYDGGLLHYAHLTEAQRFAWACQLGRAGENSNRGAAPFYVEAKPGYLTNVGFWVAGSMAAADGSKLAAIADEDVRASVAFMATQVRDGKVPPADTATFGVE